MVCSLIEIYVGNKKEFDRRPDGLYQIKIKDWYFSKQMSYVNDATILITGYFWLIQHMFDTMIKLHNNFGKIVCFLTTSNHW